MHRSLDTSFWPTDGRNAGQYTEEMVMAVYAWIFYTAVLAIIVVGCVLHVIERLSND